MWGNPFGAIYTGGGRRQPPSGGPDVQAQTTAGDEVATGRWRRRHNRQIGVPHSTDKNASAQALYSVRGIVPGSAV
eukprot:2843056-Pyramimonas_sp.AAC.1